ncbi:MAG: efflux RND transporter permease subunit, partial [Myxococcota bacterium]
MKVLERLIASRRMVLVGALLLAGLGATAWQVMPRQEDPTMQERWGFIRVPFPGASATRVERLIVKPLERELTEVADVGRISATARANGAFVQIEMVPDADFTAAWDDIRDALRRAEPEFPRGAGPLSFERQGSETEGIVYAVTGHNDPRVLALAARRVEERLLQIPDARRVVITADPKEQITVTLDDGAARRYALTPELLLSQLRDRNHGLSAGTLQAGDRTAILRVQGIEAEGDAAESELRTLPILLPGGQAVELGEVATVRRTVREPEAVRMRWNGEPAVAVGIVPKDGLHLTQFGQEVRTVAAELGPELAPLTLREMSFQPDQVEERLGDLSGALLLGILVVGVLLILTMGARLGFVVALVVPVVTLGSLAIYFFAGGVLHQISVAAFVLALGMLVDNAIVVAELTQRKIDQGSGRREAAIAAIRELAFPLATATGTTLAAFVPMLLATGDVGDFTRAIPVIVMLTLTVSYLFALTLTPTLAARLLRPRNESGSHGFDAVARRLGDFAVRRRRFVLTFAIGLVALTVLAGSRVEENFFPAAGRSELLVNLQLPEGAALD